MKILLDTNAYSAFMRGHAAVVSRVRDAQEVLISNIVLGELFFGFRNGSRFDKNLKELQSFLDSPFTTLIPVSFVTAELFGQIATDLRKKGHPIPSNDIWIAAHNMETGAHLLSYDQHFNAIDGLRWTELSKP